MQVKDQIRARREALGMDMNQLALRVGVTEQAVRHWENGRSYPSKAKTRLLEQALSFSLDWSEGENPITEGRTAAAMIDQRDVDLLLVICQLPLRAKQVMADFAKIHLEAVQRARGEALPSEQLTTARAAVAGWLPPERSSVLVLPRDANKPVVQTETWCTLSADIMTILHMWGLRPDS